jgi:hypothetical protein
LRERKKKTGDCFVEAINFRSLLDDEKRFVGDYNLHNIKKKKPKRKSTDGKVSRGFKKFVFLFELMKEKKKKLSPRKNTMTSKETNLN